MASFVGASHTFKPASFLTEQHFQVLFRCTGQHKHKIPTQYHDSGDGHDKVGLQSIHKADRFSRCLVEHD